jgi:hypothetical protein
MQPADLADAADVLGAVLRGEPEVAVQAVTDVVPVEDVGRDTALDQGPLDGERQGGLARAGQAGEPHRGGAVPEHGRRCGG